MEDNTKPFETIHDVEVTPALEMILNSQSPKYEFVDGQANRYDMGACTIVATLTGETWSVQSVSVH